MRLFNTFTMIVCTILVGFFYLISTCLLFVTGMISGFFFWTNKNLAIALIWSEREFLRVKGADVDEEFYKESIDILKNL